MLLVAWQCQHIDAKMQCHDWICKMPTGGLTMPYCCKLLLWLPMLKMLKVESMHCHDWDCSDKHVARCCLSMPGCCRVLLINCKSGLSMPSCYKLMCCLPMLKMLKLGSWIVWWLPCPAMIEIAMANTSWKIAVPMPMARCCKGVKQASRGM